MHGTGITETTLNGNSASHSIAQTTVYQVFPIHGHLGIHRDICQLKQNKE